MVGSYEGSHDLVVMITSLCAVAIIGFTSGEKVVTEGEDFYVCVHVTKPDQNVRIQLTFHLQVDLIPVTAGEKEREIGGLGK